MTSTTTLLVGATVFAPTAVETVDVSRAGRTLVHDVLGRSNPDVTLRASGLRTGTLDLVFSGEADGKAALDALAVGVVAQVASSAAALTLSFVVPEGQDVALSRARAGYWTLSVPFQEVQP